ncbi:uncharacterized protein Dana_GF27651 [Drosophila ananassae]|uniref:Uncharacterized protein n=1 Tax=Drosophila ananassae TaxID=7217 RepID=A0A0N8P177_DROAN|nr:uncharacterized protein Dana_GF27651 [Drosophila ananassae]
MLKVAKRSMRLAAHSILLNGGADIAPFSYKPASSLLPLPMPKFSGGYTEFLFKTTIDNHLHLTKMEKLRRRCQLKNFAYGSPFRDSAWYSELPWEWWWQLDYSESPAWYEAVYAEWCLYADYCQSMALPRSTVGLHLLQDSLTRFYYMPFCKVDKWRQHPSSEVSASNDAVSRSAAAAVNFFVAKDRLCDVVLLPTANILIRNRSGIPLPQPVDLLIGAGLLYELLQFPLLGILDDFILVSARFQLPNLKDFDMWGNRVVQNLLYYEANYSLLFLAIYVLMIVCQPAIISGLIVQALNIAVIWQFFSRKSKFNFIASRLTGRNAYSAEQNAQQKWKILTGALLVGYLFLHLIIAVLLTAFTPLLPVSVTFIHASLRLRNMKYENLPLMMSTIAAANISSNIKQQVQKPGEKRDKLCQD